MNEKKQEAWYEDVQVRISAWLERWRERVKSSRAKDLFLLSLPYQVAAVLTSLIAVGFAQLFHLIEELNLWILGLHPYLVLASAPFGFLLSWWLVRRFSPMAAGSGIPQLTAAIEVANDRTGDRSWKFLNLRIILVKMASSLAMVLGGGAVGREGPTIQIAGSVYRTVHKVLPPFWPKVSRRVMLITGGAAGLSAAFNTPLGGIVFAVEELTRTHIAQFRTAVLTAVIIAGMTAQWLLGPYLYLGYPKLEPVGFSFMYKVLLIGVLAGAGGALFCRGLLVLDKFKRSLASDRGQVMYVLAAALAFSVLFLLTGTRVLGSGKSLLESYLFDPEMHSSATDVLMRFLSPLVSFSAGGAGGIFAPALTAGATVGGFIAQFFDPSRGEFNVMVLAGMVAFLTGVTRSPFTSAILVLEMTDRHSAIFQLMYAASFGYVAAFAFDRKSYYEHMKERLLHNLRSEDARGSSNAARTSPSSTGNTNVPDDPTP
ncbi:MAG: chloride channel protein [Flavobacteriales bacterium]|nr:chloride channel protein [Flavobacteriales bacterium]MCB9192893.1 chloride channel protein [Flavobacteriales bacterium]